MTTTSQEFIKTYNYKITAQIHKLRINKNLQFKTKILWKRHQNKIQTRLVNHAHGFSIFNEKITLPISIQYDESTQSFIQKNTELIPIISIQGNLKSGGYAKVDMSEALNLGLKKFQKSIPILKCPDPEAQIEVTFYYQLIGEGIREQLSALNVSSRDFNMSKMQFSEDGIKTQVKMMENTIMKLDILASKISENKNGNQNFEYEKKIHILEGENKELKKQIINLEQKLNKRETSWKLEKKQYQKQINTLQKQLDKKSKQIMQKVKQIANLQGKFKGKIKYDEDSTESDKTNSKKYEEMYNSIREKLQEKDTQIQLLQQTISQFQSRLKQYSREKIQVHYGGQKSFEITQFGKGSDDEQTIIQRLQREKVQLQNQLASTSHKLAELFNVSFQIGGAQLLDKLQSSIGIIQ